MADIKKDLGYNAPDETESLSYGIEKDLGYSQPDAGELAGYKEGLSGTGGQVTQPTAVLTTAPVVKEAESNMSTLEKLQAAIPSGLTKLDVFKGMAASGQGKFRADANGTFFVAPNGAEFDMQGNMVKSAPAQSKDQVVRDVVKESLGSVTSPDGEVTDTGATPVDENPEYTDLQNKMTDIYNRADESMKSSIASIQKMTDSAIAAQKAANQAAEGGTFNIGIVTGRARYAPDIQNSIMAAQVSSGLSKINDLQNKAEQLILEAQNARDEKQFKVLSEKMRAYEANRKQMFDETVKTKQLAMEMEQNAIENKKTALETQKLRREESQNEALNYAPAIIESMAGMTPEEQNAYLIATAEESGGIFDAATLKNAIDSYKRGVQAEKLKGTSEALQNWYAEGGQAGTGMTSNQYLKWYANLKNEKATGGGTSGFGGLEGTGNLSYTDPIFDAIMRLPTSTRDIQLQRYSAAKAAGDTESMSNIVDSVAKGSMTGTVLNSYVQLQGAERNAVKAINKAAEMMTKIDPEDANKTVGFNWWENISERTLKPLFGESPDPDVVELVSAIGLAQAQLRNQIYGATITKNEKDMATQFFADFGILSSDTITSATQKMEKLLEYVRNTKTDLLGAYGGRTDQNEIKVEDSAKDALEIIKSGKYKTQAELMDALNNAGAGKNESVFGEYGPDLEAAFNSD